MAYDNFLVDKRVVERNIKKGLVDPEALRQQIDGLPDRESNCVHVSLEGGAQSAADDSDQLDAAAGAEPEQDDLDDEGDEDDEDDEDDADDQSAPRSEGGGFEG